MSLPLLCRSSISWALAPADEWIHRISSAEVVAPAAAAVVAAVGGESAARALPAWLSLPEEFRCGELTSAGLAGYAGRPQSSFAVEPSVHWYQPPLIEVGLLRRDAWPCLLELRSA